MMEFTYRNSKTISSLFFCFKHRSIFLFFRNIYFEFNRLIKKLRFSEWLRKIEKWMWWYVDSVLKLSFSKSHYCNRGFWVGVWVPLEWLLGIRSRFNNIDEACIRISVQNPITLRFNAFWMFVQNFSRKKSIVIL